MIRQYLSTDRASLLKVIALNIPEFFAAEELNDFENYLDEESDNYFVIENNEQILGGFGYLVDMKDKTGSIKWIFFHPEITGKGYGSKAVNYCFQIFRDRGIHKISVDTSQLACRFFERHGFVSVEFIPDYWATGLDLVRMKIEL